MLRRFALLLAFTIGIGTAWAVSHAQQKVDISNATTHAVDSDQRGISATPLAINALSLNSEEVRKETEQKRFNRWTIGLTLAIAICAFLQVLAIVGQIIVYCGQSKLMAASLKETARAAKAAEDAVKSSNDARALAEDTARRQLRAYICVNTAALELFSSNMPSAIVNFKNCGQTPAYDVRVWIHTWIAHYPLTEILPTPPEDFQMSSNTIGPGGTTQMVPPKKPPLNQFLTSMLGSATATYFVYGQVTYKDVFGQEWYTNYRLMYGGPRGNIANRKAEGKDQVWVLSPDVEGNEAT